MAKLPDLNPSNDSLITQGVIGKAGSEAKKFDTNSADIQYKLATYAKKLEKDSLGLVFGKDAELHSFRLEMPLLVGRLNKDIENSNFLDLTPYNGNGLGVSRVHARFQEKEGKWFVEDMNSRNGTFLNEKRLDMFSAKRLNHGDKLRMGNFSMLVVLPRSEADIATVFKLTAVIGKEDCLSMMQEQLMPYLSAFAEAQEIFNAENPKLVSEVTQFNAVSVQPMSAIIECVHVSDALIFAKQLQKARIDYPHKLIVDTVKELRCVKEKLERSANILKLSNLARQMDGTHLQLSDD